MNGQKIVPLNMNNLFSTTCVIMKPQFVFSAIAQRWLGLSGHAVHAWLQFRRTALSTVGQYHLQRPASGRRLCRHRARYVPRAAKADRAEPRSLTVSTIRLPKTESASLGGPHLITLDWIRPQKLAVATTGMEVTLPKSLFTNHIVKEDLPKQDTVKDFDVK